MSYIQNENGHIVCTECGRSTKVIPYHNTGCPRKLGFNSLTNRELEIVKHLTIGLTVKEVAGILNISMKTAMSHKYNLFKKLDVHSMPELTRRYIYEVEMVISSYQASQLPSQSDDKKPSEQRVSSE